MECHYGRIIELIVSIISNHTEADPSHSVYTYVQVYGDMCNI